MAGRIEVICGPMFSGKSEELLRRLNRAIIAKRKFQLFKPKVDNRYSETEVVSHSGQRMECEVVDYAEQIMTETQWDTRIIGIDEAQFFGLNIASLWLDWIWTLPVHRLVQCRRFWLSQSRLQN